MIKGQGGQYLLTSSQETLQASQENSFQDKWNTLQLFQIIVQLQSISIKIYSNLFQFITNY